MLDKHFTKEEIEEIKSLGGFDELMKTLEQRLKEQKKRHQGGNKWIGTAGKSPFGAYGYNPEGIRIRQHERGQGKAVKVWDKRVFRDFDDTRELDTRGMQVALKRLRQWAELVLMKNWILMTQYLILQKMVIQILKPEKKEKMQ